MPTQKGPTLEQVAKAVGAELTAPTPLDEVVSRILERWHSRAKKPEKLIRTHFRYNAITSGIVFLDAKTVAPLSFALQGVRFRIPLERDEIKQGVLFMEPDFTPFLKSPSKYDWKTISATFLDVNNQPIPARVIALPVKMRSFLGKDATFDHPAFELRDWLAAQHAQPGDSILATALDFDQSHFRLAHELRAKRHKQEIEKQNRAFADLVWQMLQDTVDEKLLTHQAIPTAFARLPSAREYPGDHWLAVLRNDERLRVTDWMIVPGDHKFPFDLVFEEPGTTAIKEQPFTREQAGKVYHFRATANYPRKTRIIEILGKQTLGDFDDVMREAFDLDPMDHLSEFTRIIRRGKGKQPHRQQYGEINPFEPTPAMKVRIAGLGLQVGAELEYVYDFGDWLDHQLILESIGDAEKNIKYPRVVIK